MREENIKDLVFREEPAEERKIPMYRSIRTSRIREEYKKGRECHRTFGLPKEMVDIVPLKKGTRLVIRPDVEKWKPDLPLKTPVPRRSDWSRPLQKDHPNYLLKNALTVVASEPPTGPSRAVDPVSGVRYHDCNATRQVPGFPEGFGQVPTYLAELKAKAAEREEAERKAREAAEEEARRVREQLEGRLLEGKELQDLLSGLKQAWAGLNKQYQHLPLVVDSVPAIRKKRYLEATLDRLEKNIALLERSPAVFVFGRQELCNPLVKAYLQ